MPPEWCWHNNLLLLEWSSAFHWKSSFLMPIPLMKLWSKLKYTLYIFSYPSDQKKNHYTLRQCSYLGVWKNVSYWPQSYMKCNEYNFHWISHAIQILWNRCLEKHLFNVDICLWRRLSTVCALLWLGISQFDPYPSWFLFFFFFSSLALRQCYDSLRQS